MTPNNIKIHKRKCTLCEATCGIVVEHDDEKVLSIRGNPDDPFSRGYHCIKAEALADLHEDENRLRTPMRRTGENWRAISWDEAFRVVTENLKRIQKKHGKDGVGIYLGNPNVHNLGTTLFGLAFLRSFRTNNRFSATSIDQLPHHLVGRYMFGHQLLIPIPDIDRTDYFLIMGANPVVSRGSIMTAPDVGERIKDIGKRGGKVIVVDPRKTETAALADVHYFIKPSSDAMLLRGLIHIIFKNGWEKPGRILDISEGFDKVKEAFADFSLSDAARATGISESQMESIARDFSHAKSAVCYGRLGVSTQKFGGLCQWLVTVLNAVTGNLDRPGGAMFTRPAFDILPHVPRGGFGKRKTRLRGLPSFGGEFPVVALADEMLHEGQGQIRGLLTVAGNPVLSTPDGKKLDQAISGLDFRVAIDFYINETTRHADIILPPTSALEHSHYDVVFNLFSVRNTAAYSLPLFKKPKKSLHDWEIMLEIETRLLSTNFAKKVWYRLRQKFFEILAPEGLLALGLRNGPYGAKFNPFKNGITLQSVKKNPNGLDLGALQSELPQRLFTKSKKIDLAPSIFLEDMARLAKEKWEYSELLLIGRRALRSNNSWLHNTPRTVTGKSMCTALMNPLDAEARNIKAGDTALVSTRVGSIKIKTVLTDKIMPGVISIPHGYGHDRKGVRLDVAAKKPGVSVNDITDTECYDALSGNAAVNGIAVTVVRSDEGH